jgi:hypothetical protein
MKMDNSMKFRIALGLCAVLGVGFVSVRAADTPAQAAARSALIQKLNQSVDSPSQPLPATNTLSETVVEQPAKSAATVTEMVPAKAMTPQTASVTTTPVAPPVAVTPAAVVSPVAASPAPVAPAVAPVAVSPAAVAPTRSFLLLSLLFLSLLLVLLLIMALLMMKLRTLKLLLLKHPAILATGKLQPAAAPATPMPTPAPVATKRPVQRRKRVHQQNGAESNGAPPKNGWANAKEERRESRIKG